MNVHLLDQRIEFHVQKFIALEVRRMALSAKEKRATALIELQLIECRLNELREVLR